MVDPTVDDRAPRLSIADKMGGHVDMATRIRRFDWSTTSLGPIGQWPFELKTLVELMLSSPLATVVVCGAQRVLLCNDAATCFLEPGRSSLLGREMAEVFPQDSFLGPGVFDRAFTGEAVVLKGVRFDSREGDSAPLIDAYLAPLRNDSGSIAWLQVSMVDATLRLRAERKERTLSDLNHHIRNTLGIVRSITRRTAEVSESVDYYAQHLEGRFDALARAQSIIARSPQAEVALDTLIAEELMVVGGHENEALAISGPAIRLQPRSAQIVGLAIHELTTNAVKFGALSPTGGKLDISWHILAGEPPRLSLRWKETGLSLVDKIPRRRGFGSDLLKKGLSYELDANTLWMLEPDGLHCTIDIPLDRIV